MKNRYIFISDIHGCYDKMMNTLNKIDFNKNTDILVSVGDAFDRGKDNIKVLNFLLSIPHKILLWGNHDFRLRDLVSKRKHLSWIDYSNGTTVSLTDFGNTINIYDAIDNIYYKKTTEAKQLMKYFDQCVYCLEFSDLYVTHGWMPYTYFENKTLNNIPESEWEDATWSDTEAKISSLDLIDKPLLVGHYHAFRIAEDCYNQNRNGKDLKTVDTSLFISPDKKLICIDGCSNLDVGTVNAYVYETDEKPIIYKKVR